MKTKGRGAFLERTSFTGRNLDQPLVSIIVPHYRDVETIGRSLSSLRTQRYGATELIVVDDGSPDDEYAEVERQCGHMGRVVRTSHRGPAAARNYGARMASGAVLVFCESDATYPPDYVAAIVRPILACPDGSVVAANNVGRLILDETAGWGHRYARLLYAAVDDAIRCGLRRTGAWAFEAQWFRSLGGYRENLWVGEDMDLVERVVASGRKVAYGGDVPFLHREPGSLWQLLRRAWRSGAGGPHGPLVGSLVIAGALAGGWVATETGLGGLAVGAVLLPLAALTLHPTWRLVVGFSVRNARWSDLMVASIARLAWTVGYVAGGLAGATRLRARALA